MRTKTKNMLSYLSLIVWVLFAVLLDIWCHPIRKQVRVVWCLFYIVLETNIYPGSSRVCKYMRWRVCVVPDMSPTSSMSSHPEKASLTLCSRATVDCLLLLVIFGREREEAINTWISKSNLNVFCLLYLSVPVPVLALLSDPVNGVEVLVGAHSRQRVLQRVHEPTGAVTVHTGYSAAEILVNSWKREGRERRGEREETNLRHIITSSHSNTGLFLASTWFLILSPCHTIFCVAECVLWPPLIYRTRTACKLHITSHTASFKTLPQSFPHRCTGFGLTCNSRRQAQRETKQLQYTVLKS